jgi:DivIVA domain-containing protein
MALERGEIEKRDFPTGRRGYDPRAVDAHLARLADEVERLREAVDRVPPEPTAAATASDRVRSIVEAAERSAGEIEEAAREEAARTREEADAESRERVERVSTATGSLLGRVDALDSELAALIERLREGATRLQEDLEAVEGELGELRAATGAEDPVPAADEDEASERAGSEPGAPARRTSESSASESSASESSASESSASESSASESSASVAPDSPAHASETSGADSEGARLVALNMALSGTPREETERYLEANFSLEDRAGLLDDVYARVEA